MFSVLTAIFVVVCVCVSGFACKLGCIEKERSRVSRLNTPHPSIYTATRARTLVAETIHATLSRRSRSCSRTFRSASTCSCIDSNSTHEAVTCRYGHLRHLYYRYIEVPSHFYCGNAFCEIHSLCIREQNQPKIHLEGCKVRRRHCHG